MEFDAEKFEIEEVNDWVILRKYHGNDEKLVIPEGVTDIDFGAFGESLIDKGFCTKEIVLPESLTTIYGAAFAGFRNLEKINLPPYLKSIGEMTFFNCPKLKELKVPASVSAVYRLILAEDNINLILPDTLETVSQDCVYVRNSFSNEETVKALLKNPVYEIIDDYMVNTNTGTLLFKVHEFGDVVDIPAGISEIASDAFSEGIFYEVDLSENEKSYLKNLKRIKEVHLPASVKRICSNAFSWCEKIEKITYDGNPKNLIIERDAFEYCYLFERNAGSFLTETRKPEPSPGDGKVKKDKKKRFTHLMLERLVIINKILKSGLCLNSEQIRQKVNEELNLFDVEDQYSLRTISTDIETLIDRFDAPILYDRKKHGYVYTDAFDLQF